MRGGPFRTETQSVPGVHPSVVDGDNLVHVQWPIIVFVTRFVPLPKRGAFAPGAPLVQVMYPRRVEDTKPLVGPFSDTTSVGVHSIVAVLVLITNSLWSQE